MLPEHKETIIQRYHRSDYRAPSLDEQQMEVISRVLSKAYEDKRMVTVAYHDNTVFVKLVVAYLQNMYSLKKSV